MNSKEIFALALNLQSPWKINDVQFEKVNGKPELTIELGYERGSKFADESGQLCAVHDTHLRRWRHLNFFEHLCYLSCHVPRIKTSEGKVKTVEVPWARAQSGFTLLFEGYVMALIESEMPVNKVGQLLEEDAHMIYFLCGKLKFDYPHYSS